VQSAKCRFGFGCYDTDFVPPRTWTIRHISRPHQPKQFCETDELLLDDCYYQPAWRVAGDIYSDFHKFYSHRGLGLLSIGIGAHAIIANTNLDEQFRESVQSHAVSDPDAFSFGRRLGAVSVVIPTVVALWSLGECLEQEPSKNRRCLGRKLNAWGAQTARALFVGATATGVLQVVIGASRPSEDRGSKWRPFADANGVSGHALVGAVPFLVAAKYTDSLAMKSGLIFASGLTAYSRVYEDKHYLSQALLGLWIAHLAVESTVLTNQAPQQYRWVPITRDGYTGVGVEFRR